MPRPNTALLAQTLRDLSERLPEWFEQLPALLTELWHAVILPVGLGLIAASVWVVVLRRLYRYVVPPGAAQLHSEALQALRWAPAAVVSFHHNNSSGKSTNKYERQTEQLLRQALQQDPEYVPARLSLAALYLYRQRNVTQAQQVLMWQPSNSIRNNSTSASAKLDPLIQGLLLDAQALQAGQDQMVQAELREAEFLHPAFAVPPGPLLSSNNNNQAFPTELSQKKNR